MARWGVGMRAEAHDAVAAYKIDRRERPEGPWSIAGVEGTNAVRRVSEATEATVTSQERGK